MSFLQDGLEQRLATSWTAFQRRTVEDAHAIGILLIEARDTADRREGGFRGVLARAGIPQRTGYDLIELVRRHPEVCEIAHFSSVAAALQAPADEPPEQPVLDLEPAPVIPAPEPTAEPSEPPELDSATIARINACRDDDSYSEAEHARMRGNVVNVMDGLMSPEKFLDRWERKPPAPAPETPAAPVVVTPVEDAPEPAPEPTERAEVRPAEPRRSKAQEELDRAKAELAEERREKQMLLFEKEDLEQQVKVAEDKLAQHAGEASNVGGGIAGAELRKLQAEKRTWQGRAWEWQQKYEDERRLAAALKRQLKQYTG